VTLYQAATVALCIRLMYVPCTYNKRWPAPARQRAAHDDAITKYEMRMQVI
jgi:hypothetical protein